MDLMAMMLEAVIKGNSKYPQGKEAVKGKERKILINVKYRVVNKIKIRIEHTCTYSHKPPSSLTT